MYCDTTVHDCRKIALMLHDVARHCADREAVTRLSHVSCVSTLSHRVSQVLVTVPKVMAAVEFVAHDQQMSMGSVVRFAT